MKDNKGMTIVEIMISVCIIALVLALLFSLLIQVRNEENNNSIQSNFLMTQSTFITQIEEDIVNYGVEAIAPCMLGNTGVDASSLATNPSDTDKFKCIQINYAADYLKDNVGFITIYKNYKNYKEDEATGEIVGNEEAWSISYQRGSYRRCDGNGTLKNPVISTWKFGGGRLMKELPSEIDLNDAPYVIYTSTDSMNAASLVIPIVNLEGEHYDINLSFTFEGNSNFICSDEAGSLECKCESSDSLCKHTLVKSGDDSMEATANIDRMKLHLCPTS